MYINMGMKSSKKKIKRVDENASFKPRDIDKELPMPIGIFGENVHNSSFIGNTFVDVPTPMFIRGTGNIFYGNRSINSKKNHK